MKTLTLGNGLHIVLDKFENLRIDRTKNSSVCSNCEQRFICGGDSTHTWNFDKAQPNYCITKMFNKT